MKKNITHQHLVKRCLCIGGIITNIPYNIKRSNSGNHKQCILHERAHELSSNKNPGLPLCFINASTTFHALPFH